MDTMWQPDLDTMPGPKYLALARALREDIQRGGLAEGARLPPVRELAWALHVTPGTVQRAYQLATREGLLEATVGRGTFVAARKPGQALPQPADGDFRPVAGRLDLRSPDLPEVGQKEALAAALQRISGKIDSYWLDYPVQSHEAPLRAAVCDWVVGRELGTISAEDVVLSHGGQNAVSLALTCCLRGDRPVVATEELCYPGFRFGARQARAEVFGVELDDEGMRPDALEAICRNHAVQVVMLTPEAQNPTAARMSLARRQEIVSIARRYNLQIVEDECYAPRTSEGPTLRALAPERTWYVGSLSKTFSPGLRFGFMICPDGMGDTGRRAAQQSYFGLSAPVASLVQELIDSGDAAAVRARVLEEFDARSALAAERLAGYAVRWQAGLPYGWIELPSGWRASSFTRRAEAEEVLVRPADQYAMVSGRAPNAVRFTMAGNVPRERFDAGMQVLAHLLAAPPADMAV